MMKFHRIISGRAYVWLVVGILVLLAGGPAAAGATDAPALGPATTDTPPAITGVRVDITGTPLEKTRYAAMAEALVGLPPGTPLTAEVVQESTERLRLSRRFATIHVDSVASDDGEMLIFTLTPYRQVRKIRIQGNYPIFEQEILNQMSLYPGDPYTAADLEAQVDTIASRFTRAGYIAPLVSLDAVDLDADGTAVIVVDIDKGPHYLPGVVTFTGNRAISDAALKRRLSAWRSVLLFGSGRFSEHQLKQDLNTLLALYRRKGYADAELDYRIDGIGTDRRVDVTITIHEGARYRVAFEGNRHFWNLTLKKDVVLFTGGNRNNSGVRKSIRNLKQRYAQAGFGGVTIQAKTTATDTNSAGRINLRFIIDEGPQTIVKTVAFSGNTAIADETVRDQVLTRPPGLLHDGAFVPEVLDEDVYAATILYMQEGFQACTVTPDLSFSDDRTEVDVAFDIHEGPQTLVRRIDIAGRTILPEEKIRAALIHQIDKPFRQAVLESEKEAIASLVAEEGYPHAKVDATVAFSDDRTTADIVHTVDPGPRVVLGDIFISGNLRTKNRVIRRELTLEPGSPLALRTLHDGQRQLRDLDIFNSVGYRAVGLKEKAETVNLFVDIQERRPYYLQASTGYESDRGLFGRIKAGDRNLFGLNKHLWASAQISETGYHLESQLSEPRFLGTRTTASVGAFHEEITEFNQSFGTRATGVSLNFDRPLGRHLSATLGLGMEQRRQFSVDDREEETIDETSRTIFVTTPSLRYDSRDSFVRPTKGLYSSIRVDISKGLHQQIDDFFRYQFDNRFYHSITDGITLAAMARIGQVVSYTQLSDVPDDQLFFLGGIQDVRGYEENLLRFDADGNAVGGRTAMVGSLEARIELGMNVELTAFFDIGSVQDAMVDEGADSFRSSVGLGLRYITPIGPVGLLYGHKLNRQAGESDGRFHISIGYSF